MKPARFAAVAVPALIAAAAPAAAGTLLNVTNLDASTTYTFNVTATAASTPVSFAGYNGPAYIAISRIDFYADSDPSTNLLGATWTFTPAPAGSDSFTYDDGSGVPALAFGSTVVGSYDSYAQTVATTAGSGYELVFTYLNTDDPSGLIVSAGPIPEPATWALMIGGFGLVGATLRRRTAALAA